MACIECDGQTGIWHKHNREEQWRGLPGALCVVVYTPDGCLWRVFRSSEVISGVADSIAEAKYATRAVAHARHAAESVLLQFSGEVVER